MLAMRVAMVVLLLVVFVFVFVFVLCFLLVRRDFGWRETEKASDGYAQGGRANGK
jgi:uncharacterized membrane protein